MNILEQIVSYKRKEVSVNRTARPVKELEKSNYFDRSIISLKASVLNKNKYGIISEIKRKSPSKGVINTNVSIERISKGYVSAGTSAISVLTDTNFFGGSNDDLIKVRELNNCPVLRKDFIVDEYQLVEAKSIGADAILLIVAALPVSELKSLSKFAVSLGLEILLEVHNEEELLITQDIYTDLVGVNNRNLKTFEVSLEISRNLISGIPNGVAAVSESGIENPSTIKELKDLGYSGFLIGQYFMQTEFPEIACRDFIEKLKA